MSIAPSVVYVDSEQEARGIFEDVKRKRAIAHAKASVGYVLILGGLIWPFIPLFVTTPAPPPVIYVNMIYIGAAWVTYCKGANLLWLLVGPFVVFLPTAPRMPVIKVGPQPSIAENVS